MKTYTTTANAYNSMEDLKKSGFEFVKATKQWTGDEVAYNDFKERFCNPKYCGSRAYKNANVKFATC